ncbi:MAG TPA: hypothetical protein VF756_18945 [Thermoanaerobaculia bacterium]
MIRPVRHALACLLIFSLVPACAQEPHFTDPPGPDTPEVTAQLGKAKAALESGRADVSAILSDPTYLPLHERPSFRELIRKHARSSRMTIVTPKEPGERLIVTGTLRSKDGRPLGGALVYAYQTSAKGWYSDRAAHYTASSGDDRHARLFGYLTTDPSGRFEITTIRPEGYPQSRAPQHIHLEVYVGGRPKLGTEILFEDDPRMTTEARRLSREAGFYLVPVRRGADGVQRCAVEIRLPE